MKLGLRNIIGNSISGGNSPTPPAAGNFLLWKILSVNKILVRSSNGDLLVWKT